MSGKQDFRPDGWGSEARLGLITPHLDVVPEGEFRALAPADVSIHVARVPLGWRPGAAGTLLGLDAVRAFAQPPYVDDAVEMLAAAPLGAIAYGFTSSSYLLGPRGDATLRSRLEARASGVPVIIPCQSVLAALRVLGLGSLALVNPPWFPPELSEMGAEYFRQCGVEVTGAVSATGMAPDPMSVTPAKVHDWLRDHDAPAAECVFLGGGGLRAVGAIEALEATLGRPVLTANQVAFWHALRVAGVDQSIEGYGELLKRPLPA